MPGAHPKCEVCNHDVRSPHKRHKCELNGEMRCKQCQRDNKHNHNIHTQQTQTEHIKPVFHPTLTIHSHLSFEKRAAIVAFHRIGMDKYKIMKYLACSMPTVNHWIKHYNQHFTVTHTQCFTHVIRMFNCLFMCMFVGLYRLMTIIVVVDQEN